MHKVLNQIFVLGFLIGFCGFVCACQEESNGDTGEPEIYDLLENKLFGNKAVNLKDCKSVENAMSQLKNNNSYKSACEEYGTMKQNSTTIDEVITENRNAGYYMAAYIWIMQIYDNLSACDNDEKLNYKNILNECEGLFDDADEAIAERGE